MRLPTPATASAAARLPQGPSLRPSPLGASSDMPRPSFWPRMLYCHVPAIGVIAYPVILLVPYWWLNDWRDLANAYETHGGLGFQVAGFLVFSISVLPLLIRYFGVNEFITMTTPRGVFVAFFFLLTLILPVIAGTPSFQSVAYTIITWSLIIVAGAFWSIDHTVAKRALGWASVCILFFLIILLIKHGVSNPGTAKRGIGGIQPNSFAQAALVGLTLAFFLPRWLTYPAVATAITLMLIASSRSQLVGAIAFLLSYGTLTLMAAPSSAERLGLATAMLAVTGAVLMLDLYLLSAHGSGLLAILSERVLLLDDPIRGLGSGFTGRTEHWEAGLKAISQAPVLGYGFRRQIVTAHQGYLNLMSDIGIPLGVSFVIFVVTEIGCRIRTTRRLAVRGLAGHGEALLHRLIAAYLISVLAEWVFEPSYLNLGVPYTVFFLLFLAAPRGPAVPRLTTAITGRGPATRGPANPRKAYLLRLAIV